MVGSWVLGVESRKLKVERIERDNAEAQSALRRAESREQRVEESKGSSVITDGHLGWGQAGGGRPGG